MERAIDLSVGEFVADIKDGYELCVMKALKRFWTSTDFTMFLNSCGHTSLILIRAVDDLLDK